MDRRPAHARTLRARESYSLRSSLSAPGTAAWGGLPERDRALLRWLLVGDLVTSELAAILAYGSLRSARRRLARLVELRLVRGFWAANSQRPRGRYAYALTASARLDLERAAGYAPVGRRRAGPGPSTIHRLATNDLLAAFLRDAHPAHGLGLLAWLPERIAAQLFDGYVEPDAVAIIGTPTASIGLIVERDLGTESASVLAAKVARYTTILAGRDGPAVNIAIVVESPKRVASIRRVVEPASTEGAPVRISVAADLMADPYGSTWTSSYDRRLRTTELPGGAGSDNALFGALCLLEVESLEAFDGSAVATFPALAHFARRIR